MLCLERDVQKLHLNLKYRLTHAKRHILYLHKLSLRLWVAGIWFYSRVVKPEKIGLKQVYCYLNTQITIGFK
jgi:hypothetical protein